MMNRRARPLLGRNRRNEPTCRYRIPGPVPSVRTIPAEPTIAERRPERPAGPCLIGLRTTGPRPSPAWWGRHLASPQRQRTVGIAGAGCPRPSHGCCVITPPPSRTAGENSSDPLGLKVQPVPGARIALTMRVHDSGSKMDDPLSGSCWRGRWPRSKPVPEILSAALRWAK
jgi:hypothetical protein